RSGARARQAPALDHADGRDRPNRLDEIVDMRVDGRVVSPRAGRDPSAEGRELERAGKVAQPEVVLLQLLLEPRTRCARLDARGARDRVNLQYPIKSFQVDRHDAGVAV